MKILINETQYRLLIESEEKFISLGQKYFPNINPKLVKLVYSKLKENNALSTYNFNWILLLIENKVPNVKEDLDEYASYLNIFDRFKNKIKSNGNQIELFNKQTKNLIYKSKSDLYSVVEPFFLLEKSDLISNIRALAQTGEIDMIYEDDNNITFALLTYNASKILCAETNFCTRFPDQYWRYTKTSPLFIFIDKHKISQLEKDPDSKYEKVRIYDNDGHPRMSKMQITDTYKKSIIQYDDNTGQFMDREDHSVYKKDFYKENSEAVNALFKKYINQINKIDFLNFVNNVNNLIKVMDIKESDLLWKFSGNRKYGELSLYKKNKNLLLFKTDSYGTIKIFNFNPLTKVFSSKGKYDTSNIKLETLLKLDQSLEQILKDNNIKLIDIKQIGNSGNILRDLEEKFKVIAQNKKTWSNDIDLKEIILNEGDELTLTKGIIVPIPVKLNGGKLLGAGFIRKCIINNPNSFIAKGVSIGGVYLYDNFKHEQHIINMFETGIEYFKGKKTLIYLPNSFVLPTNIDWAIRKRIRYSKEMGIYRFISFNEFTDFILQNQNLYDKGKDLTLDKVIIDSLNPGKGGTFNIHSFYVNTYIKKYLKINELHFSIYDSNKIKKILNNVVIPTLTISKMFVKFNKTNQNGLKWETVGVDYIKELYDIVKEISEKYNSKVYFILDEEVSKVKEFNFIQPRI